MNGYEDAHKALDDLLRGDAAHGTLLVAGAPRSGKTGFAYDALMRALHMFGNGHAVMTVANRVIADDLGDRAIRGIGATPQVRPVTTLSALAFQVIAECRYAAGESAPRLLNGAEQDSLLRRVLAVHLGHAQAGEPCGTCMLLREYFATEDWSAAVGTRVGLAEEPRNRRGGASSGAGGNAGGSVAADEGDAVGTAVAATAELLERSVSASFTGQLRDMLARMDELGASQEREDELLRSLERSRSRETGVRDGRIDRLRIQWRLAFTLRGEYLEAVERAYPGEYRLDASRLLVEAAREVGAGNAHVPKLLVADDFQDTTVAGLRFLEALAGRGSSLLLVGNPDEAVQTFRGSYPEYLFAQAVQGPLHARAAVLDAAGGAVPDAAGATVAGPATYRDLVASRVSLSIPSPVEESAPLAERPGKLPRYEGSWPVRRLPAESALPQDGTMRGALYHSPREELDDVVWRIKRTHLDTGAAWNDMAVIAHDNGTVRTFGERLRRDGVPVRYSSVTRPLREAPFVQGLFCLIELARLRLRGAGGMNMPLRRLAAYARGRVVSLMNSPLVTAGARPGEGAPGRMEPIEAAMRSLASLGQMIDADRQGAAETEPSATESGGEQAAGVADGPLCSLTAAWHDLVRSWEDARQGDDATVVVDDSLLDGPEDISFDTDAQYVMLALDDPHAPAERTLAILNQVLGDDPQTRAFLRLWRLVGRTAEALRRLEDDAPQFVLAAAWDVAGVAGAWQRQALANTAEGRAANDRLDAAMRLFQYAEGGAGGSGIVSFIEQVRSMQIEADSLARVRPVEQAVTLTTPAGAAGRHWRFVWMPAVQQDVWPNLAERNTMFGGEDMARIILFGDGQETMRGTGAPGRDAGLSEVLSGEKKSFLYALTRALDADGHAGGVMVSAVHDDDLTPSDFLYGYMPERFDRSSAVFTVVGREDDAAPDGPRSGDGETSDAPDDGLFAGSFAGLDGDPRGLVAAARAVLARHPAQSAQARDAAATLALLAFHGVAAADPANWAYLHAAGNGRADDCVTSETPITPGTSPHTSGASTAPQAHVAAAAHDDSAPVVGLSPSAVDRLWECPVCWLLENRLSGPRPSSVATGFGTLIHAVAQRGSGEGLDRPDFMAGHGFTERVEAITSRLADIYAELRSDPAQIDDPATRYAAMHKDDQSGTVLGNIAAYFAGSNDAGYLAANAGKFDVGVLERADCEEEFAARFDLDDILAAYRAVPGAAPIGRHDLAVLMGELVGGWPEGMRDDLTVRLSGRIDRKETRTDAQGRTLIRLIDYKTGQVPSTRQRFNDLQLVCYQLGLVFPESPSDAGGGLRGSEALRHAPRIAQSGLFHVEAHGAPAQSFAPEGLFQPPLFTDGSLNAEPFTPRSHYPVPGKLMDVPTLEGEPPAGVDPQVWERFTALNGTQTLWALTMIARVFYAAAASRSEHLIAHPTEQHLAYCRMRTVCPACAGGVDTVFETRQI
ncbi:PD-(D/E)XK nuclease family protein [Bifidobacterium aesculapii]|uniref:PD-(D/E)XK nuclease family protein n=1 Tax=Bifidobacterium aesculapii TaxID=1329411 RepID=UPI0006E2FE45|nr:PD-(D/E)XK nuclease family protein [Bifidobacterium aesculapii]